MKDEKINNLAEKQDSRNESTELPENTVQENHEIENEKLKEEYKRQGRLTGIIRLVAGCYFISAVFTGIIAPLQHGSLDMPAYAVIIISVFGIFGIVLIIDGIRKLMKYR